MITNLENLTGYYMTNKVTPENEHEFQKVPFEKAVNPSFQKNLSGKLRFVAIYKGTVPDAKIRSINHLTLKLCDPVRTDVCSEKIIMPEKKATYIFDFENNQPVDVFGIVSESSGMKIGGTTISNSQVGGLGAITFFQVWAMKPIHTDEDHLNTSNSIQSLQNQEKSPERLNTSTLMVQKALTRLGYSPGPHDGIMGSKTQNAIKQFQQDKNIRVTGNPDDNTLIALDLKKGNVKYLEQKDTEIDGGKIKNETEKKEATIVQSEQIDADSKKSVQLDNDAEKISSKNETPEKGKIIETTSILAKPSFMGKLLQEISAGQVVELLEKKEDFYKIRHRETVGYVYIEFIEPLQ
jgi:hypothetical protein